MPATYLLIFPITRLRYVTYSREAQHHLENSDYTGLYQELALHRSEHRHTYDVLHEIETVLDQILPWVKAEDIKLDTLTLLLPPLAHEPVWVKLFTPHGLDGSPYARFHIRIASKIAGYTLHLTHYREAVAVTFKTVHEEPLPPAYAHAVKKFVPKQRLLRRARRVRRRRRIMSYKKT